MLDLFLHLDQHLNEWARELGPWLYGLLSTIVFCETGLVITPFLPGDSLLFAAGALAATAGSPLNVGLLIVLLTASAILGDAVNYAIGARLGPRVFTSEKSRLLNKKHLWRTQRFYERHGGKTIILARFVPIIRTFAHFVAGIGQMKYRRFAIFNVLGAVFWVVSFISLGYGFGNLPFIRTNFHYVILAIIILSMIPGLIEAWRARRETYSPPPEGSPS